MTILVIIPILMLLIAFVGSLFAIHFCWGTDHPELVALFIFIAVVALGILILLISTMCQYGVIR